MKMRCLSFLIGLIASFSSLCAQSGDSLRREVMSSRFFDGFHALPMSDADRGVILTWQRKRPASVHVLTPEQVGSALPLLQAQNESKKDVAHYLGGTSEGATEVRLYFLDRKGRQIRVLPLDLSADSIEQPWQMLPLAKSEVIIGSVPHNEELVIATIEKKSSVVHLHRFEGDGTHLDLRYDLGQKKLYREPPHTLYHALMSQDGIKQRDIKSSGIRSEPYNHPAPKSLLPQAKLYHDGQQVVLTLDIEPSHTLAVAFNLTTGEVLTRPLYHRVALCGDPTQYTPQSSYSQGDVIQVIACLDSMRIHRYDLLTGRLAAYTTWYRRNPTPEADLPATRLRNLQVGPFVNLGSVQKMKDTVQRRRFFRYVSQHPPLISALGVGEQLALRLYSYGKRPDFLALGVFVPYWPFGMEETIVVNAYVDREHLEPVPLEEQGNVSAEMWDEQLAPSQREGPSFLTLRVGDTRWTLNLNEYVASNYVISGKRME